MGQGTAQASEVAAPGLVQGVGGGTTSVYRVDGFADAYIAFLALGGRELSPTPVACAVGQIWGLGVAVAVGGCAWTRWTKRKKAHARWACPG